MCLAATLLFLVTLTATALCSSSLANAPAIDGPVPSVHNAREFIGHLPHPTGLRLLLFLQFLLFVI
jgi:hypothetical protein